MKRPGLMGIVVAGVIAFVAAAGSQATAMPAAERFAGKVAEKVLDAANAESVAAFRRLLRKYGDLPAIARVAAGRHGRGLTAGERKAVEKAVEQIILKGFARYSRWLRGERAEVTQGANRRGRTISVVTRIVGGEVDTIKWKLTRRGRSFRVVDINVAGMWLTMQVRSKLSDKLKHSRGNVIAALGD